MGDPDTGIVKLAEARIGRVLRGKWQLDELLGIGGMAAVYSATHRNGKRVAIKVLRQDATLVPEVKARFLREGYLANKVGHPGALSILDDDVEEDGTVFLVMELLEGETLEQRAERQGVLPWEDVLPIAYQVLDVLVAAHAKQIVHRDVKPGNVFLDAETGVKVLDFGIARLHTVQLSSNTTGHDTALGTPGFMPPEQARGRSDKVDSRSDLFGLGATMFAVMAGRHVHEAETVNEQLMLAMTEQAQSLKTFVPDLPDSVVEIVDRALAFEQAKRWQDADEMQTAIAKAYEALVGSAITGAPRLSVVVWRKSRSVHPDAPTMAAGDVSGATTRPSVSSHSARQKAVAPATSRRGWWLVAAAAVVVVAIGWLSMRPREPALPPAPAARVAAQPPTPKRAETKSEPTPPPPPPSASATETERPRVRGKTAKPGDAKPASAKPSAAPPEIDIFGKRK
jgi:eukaryotic-like serine/threonine-protein kinase